MRREERNIILSIATTIVGSLFLIAVGFGGGFFVSAQRSGGGDVLSARASSHVDLEPLWKAWDIINEKFVPASVATSSPLATTTVVQNQRKVYGMIDGLAASLNDPYTFFLPPVENKRFESEMSGSFEGVGMEIEVKNEILTVVSPLKGTPSERAGIRSGDQILKIDGVSTEGMDASDAVGKIRGPRGTKVDLFIMRASWSVPRSIKVTRDVISVPIVISTERDDGIFNIQLTTFTANSPDLFRKALRQFVESGGSRLIVDMRGNPGGYLDAAVDIGSWFLPGGAIIVTEDYAGKGQNIVRRSAGYNIFNENLKMVVLVDRGSASASEILALALKHYGVATIIGTNTFGKGSVQELVQITPETSLKITVARWLGPDGAQIPREGIAPDTRVDLTEADHTAHRDPQLDAAVRLLGGVVATSTSR